MPLRIDAAHARRLAANLARAQIAQAATGVDLALGPDELVRVVADIGPGGRVRIVSVERANKRKKAKAGRKA